MLESTHETAPAENHHSPTLVEADRTSVGGVAVSLGVLAIVIAIIAYMLYGYFVREAEAVRHAQVLSRSNDTLQALHVEEHELLTTAGVVDEEKGIYRVPLNTGIALFVREARERQAAGIPQRIVAPAAAETEAEPQAESEAAHP
ncbi:MAG TPA: hypothetical protein VN033_05720 [Vulgatibacter sp.]|nr:hypothetical protein [Vulgatibacter sp.]